MDERADGGAGEAVERLEAAGDVADGREGDGRDDDGGDETTSEEAVEATDAGSDHGTRGDARSLVGPSDPVGLDEPVELLPAGTGPGSAAVSASVAVPEVDGAVVGVRIGYGSEGRLCHVGLRSDLTTARETTQTFEDPVVPEYPIVGSTPVNRRRASAIEPAKTAAGLTMTIASFHRDQRRECRHQKRRSRRRSRGRGTERW